MRAVRSASRSTARRHTHGPAISSSAPATAPGASNVEDVPPPESSTTAPSAASASPPYESGASDRKLPPWRQASASPAAISAIPTTARSERPSAPSSSPPATSASIAASQARSMPRPRPEREVEDDPGAAGQRQQREDEPDERDVDREGLRDACADPRDHPLVRARRERGQRHAGSSYGALDPHRPGADVGVEHEHARAGLGQVDLDVAAVRARGRSGSWTSPTSAVPCTRTATSAGTITSRSPMSTLASTCVSPAGSCSAPRSRSSVPMPSRYSLCRLLRRS